MRIHWAVCAIACALIAALPAKLAAQTPTAPTPAQPALSADELAPWGPYARLLGQTRQDMGPPVSRLHWRWETPGQVLLEEWYRGTAELGKPSHVMTIRLGTQPGTLLLKSSSAVMMKKEWVGTLQADGSISFVGKGLLKLAYTVHIDEKGDYIQTYGNQAYRYASITDPATPVVAQMSPPSSVVPTAPPAPVAAEKPAPIVAKQESLPPAPPVRAPRKLSEADLARIRQSVQESRARSLEQARVAELQRQEAARQAAVQAQIWAAQEAQRQAEEAAADAEFEAERARKAAAWQQQAQASEQALANSLQALNDTTARIQAQQAEAAARQRAQAEALAAAERQRQVELIRQANQRQEEEAARLAAQRQQYEQQRADAAAAERARQQQQQQRSAESPVNAGRASTDTDANRCVTQSEVRQNDTTRGNTAAYIVNGCGQPVDVKICLMTETGWKCGATGGVPSQGSWSYSAFYATGPVFVDAKITGSNRPLASPN
jgi:hypothetical protein